MEYRGQIQNDNDLVNKKYVDDAVKLSGITTATVGKLPEGTDISDWSAKQVISSILMDDNPVIQIISPTVQTYEKGTSLTNVNITVRATKMVSNLTEIQIYKDNTLLTSITQGVESGGDFTYTYSGTIDDNCNIRAEVYNEGGLSGSSAISLRFIYATYSGTSNGIPTSSEILNSSKALLPAKGLTNYFTCNVERIFIAYPSSFGSLSAITDIANNLSLLDSFTQQTITLNDTSYMLYVLDEDTTVVNFGIRFE